MSFICCGVLLYQSFSKCSSRKTISIVRVKTYETKKDLQDLYQEIVMTDKGFFLYFYGCNTN